MSVIMKLVLFLCLIGNNIAFANQESVLPLPITNNAVAAAKTAKGWQLYSFNGLEKGKEGSDTSNAVMGTM